MSSSSSPSFLSRHLAALVLLAVPLASTLFLACEPERDCVHSTEPCPCITRDDCGEAPPCQTFGCTTSKVCVLVATEAGGACGDERVCDGLGKCVACHADEHCAGGGRCWEGACFRCDDGVQNGNETAVDCGGQCGNCPGEKCFDDKDCAQGGCYHERCCPVPCPACNRCDTTGACVPLPQFEDDNPVCAFETTCNGKGQCGLQKNGHCVHDTDCASLRCNLGLCTGS